MGVFVEYITIITPADADVAGEGAAAAGAVSYSFRSPAMGLISTVIEPLYVPPHGTGVPLDGTFWQNSLSL